MNRRLAVLCSLVFAGAAVSADAQSVASGPHAALRARVPVRAGAARAHAAAAERAGSRLAAAAAVPSNVTTADMGVPRPDTRPCIVPLFRDLTFADFTPKPFAYTPPAACPRPWAKVVLEAAISVTAGRQFDRTATIGIGGATVYFGTTAEPSKLLGPSWYVQRDETDLSALFAGPQMGQISIGNVVDTTYTGILHASARLLFYPPDTRFPAPRVADAVVPLADANGNPVALNTGADQLAKTFAPPPNVEAAFLDVTAQSQIGDEFWYTCFPTQLAVLLNNCGNTAFRETEVAVDARPAGVAPVYPWIYTGGIDPYLWRPIPGVQTLNFTPYRVDLSPFAGVLDDGASHTVALSVFNADNYFSVTGNLLLFLDHGARGPLRGGIDSDDLAAAPPLDVTVRGTLNAMNDGAGTIDTTSSRRYAITGHVQTSHGLVRSRAQAAIAFTQHQAVLNSATQFVQNITQSTHVASLSTLGNAEQATVFDWPFRMNYAYTVNPDGSSVQTTAIVQGYDEAFGRRTPGGTYASRLIDTVSPMDTLTFDASGNLVGTTNNASTQIYRYRDSTGTCYGRKVTAADRMVTGDVSIGC